MVGNRESELRPVEFSSPRCRYESVARFKNDKGQEFRIWVSGFDLNAVERYTKELHVDLEVLRDEPNQVLEEEPCASEQAQQSVREGEPEEQQNVATQQQKEDLAIAIEAINTQGIEPPYILRFTLDPPINKNGEHTYSFQNASQANVTITAKQGKMNAKLFQGNQQVGATTVDLAEGLPPNEATLVKSVASGASTQFDFKVIGLNNSSKYRLSGDVNRA
jgi:hypothetical protein